SHFILNQKFDTTKILRCVNECDFNGLCSYSIINRRILSATETIAYDNQQIMRLLVSVIRKMYCSPFEAVAEISLERSYITIIKDSWFLEHGILLKPYLMSFYI
ncbi:hypothetical protein NEIELOOT_01876, partial [Neisseria elongata subsp. glycolytica ATCC 29315]